MTLRVKVRTPQGFATCSGRQKSAWVAVFTVLVLALPTLQAAPFAAAQGNSPDGSSVQSESVDTESEEPNVPYIVRFRPGSALAQRSAVLLSTDTPSRGSVPQLSMEFVEFSAANHTQRAQALRNNPNVLSVEPDITRSIAAAPNDTEYSQQWALPQVSWDQAYETVTPADSAVLAVLDTGIDGAHPDLAANVVPGVSILDGSDGLTDPNGHGTNLAGIAAAVTDNGAGIAGVGYAGVGLMPVTVLAADGTGRDSDVIAGVVYAVDNGADVILMAFSDPGYSLPLQAAIDYAWDAGVVIVAAAGNDGASTPTYPAGDAGVLGVAATNEADALTSISNFGDTVFIAAPGTNMRTTSAGGGYGNTGGTSAASAMVAGAAALLAANDPAATNGQIAHRLAANADPAGTAFETGNGRLNLLRALLDTSVTATKPAATPGSGPFVGPYLAAAPAVRHNQCQPGPNSGTNGINSTCIANSNPNGWKNGLNAGPFNQGETIPYRASMTGTTVGASYTLAIEYDVTKAFEHALDYVRTFNETMVNTDACSDQGNAAICADVHTFAVPVDPLVTAGPDAVIGTADDISQLPGNFTLYGGTITSVTYTGTSVTGTGAVGDPFVYAGTDTREVTVVYTVDQASTNSVGPVLTWGGHIATNSDWINADGQGSPYHMRFNGWTCTTGGCSTGQQDLALNAAAVRAADLVITKTDDVDPIAQGATLTYTVTVTNAGPDDAVNLVVTDTLPTGVTYVSSTAACVESPTDTLTCALGNLPALAGTNVTSFDIVVTVDAGTLGTITNAASVIADTVEEDELNNSTTENTLVVLAPPQYSIVKSVTDVDGAGPGGVADADGDVITYEIVVTNTATQPINGVTVSDPLLPGLSGPVESSTADGILESGENFTYTGTYTVSQSDIDDNGGGDGDIDNTASVVSTEIPSPQTSSAAAALAQLPALTIVKTAVGVDVAGNGAIDTAGELIDYEIVVTNTGNQSINGVVVSDPLLPGLAGPTESLTVDGILEVGETFTYTGSYTVAQSDIDTNGGGDGDIDNTASVTTTEVPGPTTDSTSVPLAASPTLTIVKTAVGVDTAGNGVIDAAGELIDYEIVVTNTGNQSITNVVVSDPLLPGLSGPTESLTVDGVLEVGETFTYTGTYTVLQADIDANGIDDTGAPDGDGDIDNTASVTSTEVPGPTSDSTSVPLAASPTLTIVKTAVGVDVAGDGVIDAAGELIDYEIVVTNTGNQSITTVAVSDPLLPGLSGPVESLTVDGVLAVGETFTYTGSYTVSQGDFDDNGGGDGDIDNTASVTTTEVPGPTTDSTSVPLTQSPSLTIVKTAVGVDTAGNGVIDAAGELIDYEIVVTNTGNQSITTVVVSDPLLPGLSGPVESLTVDGVLAVGETFTYTGSYTVSQGDFDDNGGGDGDIDNTASVTTTEVPGPTTDSTSVPLTQSPSLTIVKTAVGVDAAGNGVIDAAGELIDYEIVVTNTGNQSITTVVVDDPLLPGLAGPTESLVVDGVLAVGETFTYTGSYTVSQGDIDANGIDDTGAPDGDGDIDNTASITSTEVPGPTTDGTSVPLTQSPGLTIVKTAVGIDTAGNGVIDAAGELIDYEIVVTNTGNQSINGVVVSDPLLPGLAGPTESLTADGILEVGETFTYTGTYTVTQADIDTNGGGDGTIDNTASVTTTEVPGPTPDTTGVPLTQSPALTIVKTAVGVDTAGDGVIDAAGELIDYEIVVTNTGNQSINGVVVSDPLLPGLAGPTESLTADGILEVGETFTYTGTYTVTQADIDTNGGGDGDIDNTASVTTTEVPGPTSDSTSVPLVPSPGLTIVKTAVGVDTAGNGVIDAAGEMIDFEIVVTNTDNQSITNVAVDDPLLPGLSGPVESLTADGVLEVGETFTYTGTYTVTQGDIDDNGGGDGTIDNTASVTTTEVPGPTTDTARVPLTQSPALTIVKTAVGVDVAGDGVIDAAGELIDYEIVVTNTGNQSITNVVVSDPLLPGLSGPTESLTVDGVLEVGETFTYTGTYTVLQGDIDDNGGGDGDIDNTAGVTSTEVPGPTSDTAAVPLTQSPALTILKTAVGVDVAGDGVIDAAGELIDYEIVVTNTGNQSITNVVVSDPLLPGLSGPTESLTVDGVLEVGETFTYTGTYTVLQGDIDDNGGGDGDIDNTAGVTSTEVPGPTSDTAVVPLTQSPALTILKTAVGVDVAGDGVIDAAGELIDYEIVVTNTGNQSITNVVVSDPLLPGLSGPVESLTVDGVLEVGETFTYTGTYTVLQGDIDDNGGGDGDIDNTAGVTSTEVPGPTSDTAAVPLTQSPALTILKTAVGVDVAGDGVIDAAGELIDYEIVVTNTGNQSITNVVVSDPLLPGLSGPTESATVDGILEVGETFTYTGTYTVSQGDIDTNGGGDGDIDNTAGVTTTEVPGPTSDSTSVPLVPSSAALTIVKTAVGVDVAGDGVIDAAGELIDYEIVVTNTGNQSITNVGVSDPLLPGLSGPTESLTADGILEVGETFTYTGTYTVLQADIDANGIDNTGAPDGDGDIDNTASVTTTEVPGPTSDTINVPLTQSPSLTILKTAVGVDVAGDGVIDAAGELIDYEIVVTNTGNQSITGITVNDPLLPGLAGPTESLTADGILEVGETFTYTGTYTVLQSDIDDNGGGDGVIDNTASVTTTEVPGPTPDTTGVPLTQSPALTIVKTAVGVDTAGDGVIDAAGELIDYEIVVTNTGNQSITNVSVNDPLLPGLSGPTESATVDGILEVGETFTYTGTYTVSQGDIDTNGGGDGDIDNTASVTSTEVPGPTTDSTSVPLASSAALTIAKTAVGIDVAGDGVIDAAGELIDYEIVVTNTGNQSITNVSVNDPLLPGLSGPTESATVDGILEVGETFTYTGTYTVSQGDIDDNGGGDGDIDNTASVTTTEVPGPTPDTMNVPLTQSPALTIVKTAVGVDVAGDGVIDAAGELIDYEIVVTNTGNQSITNVSVNDPLLPGLSGPTESATVDGILEVGETFTYTGTYTASQGDIDTNGGGDGDIDNTASVTSTEVPGPTTDSTSVPLASSAALTIAKTAVGIDVAGDGVIDAAGELIDYEIVVTNTGNQSITNVVVDDPLLPGLAGPTESLTADGILEVGETFTYTGTYTVLQADIDDNGGGDGVIDNTASVTTTEVPGPTPDTTGVPLTQSPALTIVKTAVGVDTAGNGVIDTAGELIDYEIVVTNTGNQSITTVAVADPLLPGLSGPTESATVDGVLAVGETFTYTGTYTVSQGDIDANGIDDTGAPDGDGDIDNTASVTSTEVPGPTSDSTSVPLASSAALTILKTAVGVDVAGDGVIDAAGELIDYEIVVTNTGNQSITNVVVSDPLLPGLSGPTESLTVDGVLEVGETFTYTGTYTVSQGDIDDNGGGDGDIDNTAGVTTTEVPGPTPDTTSVPLTQSPSLTIAKTAVGVDTAGNGVIDAAGELIDYEIVVTNTGNQSITGVSVSDPLLPGLSGPTESLTVDGVLEVGETFTYTGTYTVSQGDIDANGGGDGDIDNTASVTTTEVPGPTPDTTSVPLTQSPSLTIVKTAVGVDVAGNGVIDAAGELIDYEIVVTNTGNQSITNVAVDDPLLPGLSGPVESLTVDGVLEVGETFTYTGTYTVLQGDIDDNGGGDGDIDNTAGVTSTEVPGPTSDTAAVPLTQSPALTIVKSAVGVDVAGNGVIDAAGELIDYEIVVTNTGNQSITNVVVSDPLLPGLSGPTESATVDGILEVGETFTYTGTYTVSQGDIDTNGGGDGDIDNTAGVTTTEVPGPTSDSTSVPLVPSSAALTIVKTAVGVDVAGDGVIDAAGELIDYEIVVTNTGNQSITNVGVSDPLLPGLSGPTESLTADGILEVGETFTYTGTYTVLQADIDANGIDNTGAPDGDGDIDNTASVTTTEVPGPTSDTINVPLTQSPSLTILKTAVGVDVAGNGVIDAAGELIDYEIVVTNTGNQSITGITVNDPLLPGLAGPTESLTADGILEVGETFTYTGTYTVLQSDIDDNGGGDGVIDNTASVTTTEVPGPTPDTTGVPLTQSPALTIVKTAVGVDTAGDGVIDAAGELIDYEIVVTNTGNQSITNVSVNDPLLPGLAGPTESATADGILAVGETFTYTGSYTVTQSDIDDNGGGDGDIDNTASVTTTEVPGPTTDSTSVPLASSAALTIAKTAVGIDVAGDGVIDAAGELIDYEIVVTNTGNQSITSVVANDPLLPGLAGPTESATADGILTVGETFTYTGTYTVTQSDIDDNGGGDGVIDNTASVTTTEVPGPTPDTTGVPLTQSPSLTIVKSAVGVDVAGDGVIDAAGELIDYEIVITNTGNQSITGVSVNDPLLPGLAGPTESATADGILAVGETFTYTGSYTVTQSDIDDNGGGDGDIDNTASVTTTEVPGPTTGSTSVPLTQSPSLTIVKTAVGVDVAGNGVIDAAGELIGYEIVITNTGNQSMTGVTVDDPLLPGLSGPVESATADGILELGETFTYTGTYTVTQSDMDSNGGGDGTIDNTATVTTTEVPDPTPDTTRVPLTPALGYTIVKSVVDIDGDGTGVGPVDAAGDVVSYQIVVTNNGTQSITDVVVTDPLLPTLSGPAESANADGVLEVGETYTYTGGYTVSQADIDSNGDGDGDIDNTATVVSSEITTPATAEAEAPLVQLPGIDLDKTGSLSDLSGPTEVGDIIVYTFSLVNTGNVKLTNVTLTDPLPGLATPVCDWPGSTDASTPAETLAVAETVACSVDYAVTQADLDRGYIDNAAIAFGESVTGEDEGDDTVRVPIVQAPGLEITKTASPDVAITGELIDYLIVVRNVGNVILSDVTVSDPLPGLSELQCEWPGDDGELAAGATMECTATYQTSSADGQSVDNTATVTGLDPTDTTVTSSDDAEVVLRSFTILPPAPQPGLVYEPGPVPPPVEPPPVVVPPLAHTGSETAQQIAIVFVLFMLGGLMVVFRRRSELDE